MFERRLAAGPGYGWAFALPALLSLLAVPLVLSRSGRSAGAPR